MTSLEERRVQTRRAITMVGIDGGFWGYFLVLEGDVPALRCRKAVELLGVNVITSISETKLLMALI